MLSSITLSQMIFAFIAIIISEVSMMIIILLFIGFEMLIKNIRKDKVSRSEEKKSQKKILNE